MFWSQNIHYVFIKIGQLFPLHHLLLSYFLHDRLSLKWGLKGAILPLKTDGLSLEYSIGGGLPPHTPPISWLKRPLRLWDCSSLLNVDSCFRFAYAVPSFGSGARLCSIVLFNWMGQCCNTMHHGMYKYKHAWNRCASAVASLMFTSPWVTSIN